MSGVVVLSGGGIKGAVAAARYVRDHELTLCHVDHGHAAASAELKALSMLAAQWPTAKLCSVTLPPLKMVSSAVRAGGVASPDPARRHADDAANLLARRGLLPVMISLATQAALRFRSDIVVLGCSAHVSGEHIGMPGPEGGPDALRESLHACDIMLESLFRPKVRITIDAPLIDLSYAQIIKLGQRLNVPWQRTHSCETPVAGPCGECQACRIRNQAFLEAGVADTSTSPVVGGLKPATVGSPK